MHLNQGWTSMEGAENGYPVSDTETCGGQRLCPPH